MSCKHELHVSGTAEIRPPTLPCMFCREEQLEAERDAAIARAEKAEQLAALFSWNANDWQQKYDAAIRERDEARAERDSARAAVRTGDVWGDSMRERLQASEAGAAALREALVQIQDHARDVHSPITALGRIDIVTIRTLAATDAGAPLLAELAELAGLRARVAVLEAVREAATRVAECGTWKGSNAQGQRWRLSDELDAALRRAADSGEGEGGG